MNAAHWHLLLNHAPLFGILFGLILLITGFLTRSELLKKVSFITLILSSLITFATFKTGEAAEDVVFNLPQVSHSAIEAHEHRAETTIWGTSVLGIVSLLALFFTIKGKPIRNILSVTVLVLSLITLFLVVDTAIEGGEIMHNEIRSSEQ